MRLYNNTDVPMDTGYANKPADRIAPRHVGEFNAENRSIKARIARRELISEGEVLASKAMAMVDAPTLAEIARLRDELSKRETVIEDLRQRDAARIAEMKRVEDRFSEMAAAHADAADTNMRARFDASWKSREEEFAKQISDMESAHAAALAAAQAHIAELEATLTAPPAPAGEPKSETKATRKG
jgi:hypothetical protein